MIGALLQVCIIVKKDSLLFTTGISDPIFGSLCLLFGGTYTIAHTLYGPLFKLSELSTNTGLFMYATLSGVTASGVCLIVGAATYQLRKRKEQKKSILKIKEKPCVHSEISEKGTPIK
ncbi:hypothetical protein [Evansella clarkii]|uniref:hypothetical protein n=1 Tax=Evansella clarkii TaxID=79879 RepID=UPI001473E2A9|nr:hypothetical protein [Evansella clarkii]